MVDRGGGGGICVVDSEFMEGGGGMVVVGGRCVLGFFFCGIFGSIRFFFFDGLGIEKKVRFVKYINCIIYW